MVAQPVWLGFPAWTALSPRGDHSCAGRAECSLCTASSSFGPAFVRPLFDNGEIVRLSREVIKPYYHGAAQRALAWLDESSATAWFDPLPEGAFFMWFWCPDLPITSAELYRRLRKRNVLVVPGQYFFPIARRVAAIQTVHSN